ncbi:DUF2493 domain-containing protein [Pseudomonas nitroreducens]|uniref:DUF2493 domain-containing protein n=1 Tax=Pseudomonas nitroreducens TaxID=46680 RepID=UPI003D296603
MNIIVCGGRDYSDREAVFEVLDRIQFKRPITVLIQGGATGADALAKEWAEVRQIHCATVPAMFKAFGAPAGPMRNAAMATLGVTGVVAFPGGRGTASMVSIAKDRGINVWESMA